MSGTPLGIVIGHGSQMEANKIQGSTNKETKMADNDKLVILHSHPYPLLANSGGEDDGKGSQVLVVLSGTIGQAGEGEVPRGQSILSGAASEVDMEEGKVVCPIASRATEGGKCQ